MKLAALFGNHAVLQRDMPIPIWGWCSPHARIKIILGDQIAEYFAGADGQFIVRFPAMSAGGPYRLSASETKSGEQVTFEDIWIGEVWLTSGQSNMEWTLNAVGETGRQDAMAVLPDIRMINIPHHAFAGRQSNLSPVLPSDGWSYCCGQKTISGKWFIAGAAETTDFSAAAYYFARELQAKLQTKIGIINASWGGTCIEAWISRETLSRNPEMTATLTRYEVALSSPDAWANYQADTINQVPRGSLGYYPADPGTNGTDQRWTNCEFNDQEWPTLNLPGIWQDHGHSYSGVFRFRKTVDLPASWTGKDLIIHLGAIDKQDITYFNGEVIGCSGSGFDESCWNQERKYRVPGGLVRHGKNVIAVRVYSFVYAGGLTGPEHTMKIVVADDRNCTMPLSGSWCFRCEHNLGSVTPAPPMLGPGNHNSPCILFDNMIAPLLPYGIRGVIWYQGEANATNADRYRRLVTDLIRDWRYHWGQGDFHFIQTQLANFIAAPGEDWPALREAQLQAFRETPNSGLVVTIDIGEAKNVHPGNKREVGRRFARQALAATYHLPLTAFGPLYRSMTVENNKIRLFFDYVEGGLMARHGRLEGFMIAGSNQVFQSAEAVISADSVLVSCPDIAHPTAVRYAWEDNPVSSFYNDENLPASPFRTDEWLP